MSQHDYVIANDTAANVRADLNDALAAIASNNSGATEPTTTYANQYWYDTANDTLKIRSEANDAWISVAYLDQTANAFRILDDTQVVNTSGTQTGLIGDQTQTAWETGTSTTESLVSPAKIKAAIEALASGGGFTPTTVSGASQSLDLGSFNFFDAGTLTADTTVSFSNVPTEARWVYTFEGAIVPADWDISTASYSQNFRVAAQDTSPYDIFFKPDGLKMYVVGVSGDSVYEYNLSTAWDVSTASYSQNFSVATQDGIPTGIFFKPDGLKMYVLGASGDDVNEYNLSTAWDVSTASYSQNFSVATQDTSPYGIFFKTDGLKMYVVGSSGDSVYEYNLSTAWDVSTASYSQNFSVATQDTSPSHIFFKPDGLKMYVVGVSGDSVYEYNLSTAWDVSTASYSQNFSVAAQDTGPTGIFFKPDGLKMYVLGNVTGSVYEYYLGVPYSITLPASVENPPREPFFAGKRVTYDFFTADGGTTVTLIGEEIT